MSEGGVVVLVVFANLILIGYGALGYGLLVELYRPKSAVRQIALMLVSYVSCMAVIVAALGEYRDDFLMIHITSVLVALGIAVGEHIFRKLKGGAS